MTKSKNRTDDKVEILIAEDSPTQAAQLAHLLEQHGYAVTTASNGREALVLVNRRRPTLIISDVVMPELDGYGLCKAIKADQRWKDLPVMLVTTLSDPQDVVRGLECGADNFIRKPYDEKYILSRIDYLLMNVELRKNQKIQIGVEITLGGQRHFITSERQQILDLLISTYEQAVQINNELELREKELAHFNQVLNGLYRIADGLNQASSEREVVELALERALELPGIQAGWMFLREGESGFRRAGARNLPPALEAPGALDGDCACRRPTAGAPNAVTNILECERLQKATGDTRGLLYHASVPLWLGDRTLGVLNLVGPEKGQFREDELKVLHGVGNQLAVALERARLREHLEKLVEERTADLEAEIAEREQIEERLRVSEERFRALVENSSDGIILLDRDGKIFYASPAVIRILGYAVDAVVGFDVFTLVHPDDLDSARERFHDVSAVDARPLLTELRCRHNDGSWRHLELLWSNRLDDPAVHAIVLNYRDVTERRQSEEERRRLEAQLEQGRRISSLGRVAATIAHEFNNVLMGIQPFAEVIRRSAATDEKVQKAAGQIITSVARGKRVTQEILRFTQPAEPAFQSVVLSEWLQHLMPELRVLIGQRIEIHIEAPRHPIAARCDPAQLQQVITNLVINARDAMPNGGTITVIIADHGNERQFPFGRIPDGMVLLAVRDTGSGMLPEVLESIFEPLFTTKRSGTGLGLAVAQQVIDRHGGTIRVESTPGEGTTFYILLPAAAQASIQQIQRRINSSSVRRVLLVEDEPAVASGIATLLEGEGIEVLAVERGGDAPDATVSFRPDAVILDLSLPDMSGLDVYVVLKTLVPDLPIIFSSGHADQAALEQQIDSSSIAFLRKPYELEALLETLQKIVAGRTQKGAHGLD